MVQLLPIQNTFKINFVNANFTTFVLNGANVGTFQYNRADGPIQYYLEFYVQTVDQVDPLIPATVDNYQIGIFEAADAPTAFAPGAIAAASRHSNDIAMDPINATTLTKRVWIGRNCR